VALRLEEEIGVRQMIFEILTTPLSFNLHGKSSAVENQRYGETGLKLMNEMWRIVKGAKTANKGVNHWVYLPGGRMFTGVELNAGAAAPAELERLSFELKRYLKHVHVGPYEALPAKWKALQSDVSARGETIANSLESPGLEIYGHHCGDASKLETTILIGLKEP
jgi:hypothetical protein